MIIEDCGYSKRVWISFARGLNKIKRHYPTGFLKIDYKVLFRVKAAGNRSLILQGKQIVSRNFLGVKCLLL